MGTATTTIPTMDQSGSLPDCLGRATVQSVEADDLRVQDTINDVDGERRVADKLDAIEAERVLQRALELEAESLDQPHVITADQLHRIAKEIGVDASFVTQALGEIKLEPTARSRFQRWVVPDDLFETATVQGLTREDLDAAITKWMTKNEGLTGAGMITGGIEWNVDRRWRARMLSRSLNGGNRISRIASGDIKHRVHTVNDEEHVVAFESQGRLPLLLARLFMTVGGVIGFLALLGATVSGDGAALGLMVAVPFFALSVGLGVAGARWWARGIRGALRRSLLGLVGQASKRRKSRFRLRRRPTH